MLRSEVLPAPFGPITEISSPEWTESVTASTARTPPKCFETPEMASCASPEETSLPFTPTDTMPPAFPHPSANAHMHAIYGRHDADAGGKTQWLCPCHGLLLPPVLPPCLRHETILSRS